jgi:hypothetical protein
MTVQLPEMIERARQAFLTEPTDSKAAIYLAICQAHLERFELKNEMIIQVLGDVGTYLGERGAKMESE